jgi:hypothetical protein
MFPDSLFLGSGAILRNRDGCVERLKNGLSGVDDDASLLKTVQERPSGGGEGGVEFVARMVSRDFKDDGCSLDWLLVNMSGRQAPQRGWRQWRRLPILGVNMHYVKPQNRLAVFHELCRFGRPHDLREIALRAMHDNTKAWRESSSTSPN